MASEVMKLIFAVLEVSFNSSHYTAINYKTKVFVSVTNMQFLCRYLTSLKKQNSQLVT